MPFFRPLTGAVFFCKLNLPLVLQHDVPIALFPDNGVVSFGNDGLDDGPGFFIHFSVRPL